ncbi:MAG: hypothetical protein K6B42_05915 [Clostridia bacterium]|nr:hypothetical protein [Clostridia bacterium]
MKKKLLAILMAAAMCLCFAACGGSDEETADDQQTQTEQANEDAEATEQTEATEEAIVKGLKYEDFIGTWETTTEMADQKFGGYKITFHEDMTFDAIVTGEEESGNCTYENGVVLAENDIISDKFQFTPEGVLYVNGQGGQKATLTKVE